MLYCFSYTEKEYEDEREVQMLAMLNHPNVVSLDSVQYEEGKLLIIMELWVHSLGTEFDNALRNNKYFKEHAIRTYMKQLLKGVQHIHGHGFIHRDIKPENILGEWSF